MTTDVLLDHVKVYATAVRSHLADLSAEQVEDLTDGLEADLAEAFADQRGPVATGEVPVVQPTGSLAAAGRGTSMLDLTERFGPAVEYAAELRSAAGIEAGPPLRRRGLGERAVVLRTGVARRARAASEPLRSSAQWQRVVRPFLVTLAPLWWALRAWVLYAWLLICLDRFGNVPNVDHHFVPQNPVGLLLLTVIFICSVQVGRGGGRGRGRPWSRRALTAVNVWAILFVVPMLASFGPDAQSGPVFDAQSGPVTTAPPQNGVFVDGQKVSNLFMYDAAGNPLTQVQVFDDRGRPVGTTDDGGGEWLTLPGVAEPWTFLPAGVADGREAWNVYPLAGLPAAQVEHSGPLGSPRPIGDATPRIPPRPFAKAAAVTVPVASPSPAVP